MLLLTVDIGNSNLSLGVFQDLTLLAQAKISAQAWRSADEYAVILSNLLHMYSIGREEIAGCAICSVVPALTGPVVEAIKLVTRMGTPIFRVGPGIRTGFRICIDDPSQLGGDLVADTLAALTDYGAPVIILDAGTVTTIAAVDKSRAYLGGCILPGIRPGAALLRQATALLPVVDLSGEAERECLGRNTADAMRRGLMLGSAMMVDGFINRYTALPGMAGAKCVATGGSAALATANCRRRVFLEPNLTLKGLRYLYECNHPLPKERAEENKYLPTGS